MLSKNKNVLFDMQDVILRVYSDDDMRPYISRNKLTLPTTSCTFSSSDVNNVENSEVSAERASLKMVARSQLYLPKLAENCCSS